MIFFILLQVRTSSLTNSQFEYCPKQPHSLVTLVDRLSNKKEKTVISDIISPR